MPLAYKITYRLRSAQYCTGLYTRPNMNYLDSETMQYVLSGTRTHRAIQPYLLVVLQVVAEEKHYEGHWVHLT